MSDLSTFCRQARSRSRENANALCLLHGSKLYGNAISVVRQELDSLIRIIYLLSIGDLTIRAELISRSVAGKGWKSPKRGRITDREMLQLAERLHGWTRSVYRFGCAFIHLSNLHDYHDRDPMLSLSDEELSDVIGHLRAYHVGPRSNKPTFEEIVPYLPAVFEKISSNLECYIKELERGETLETCPG